LLSLLPNVSVVGGCCGTDHRHIEAIGHACYRQPRPSAEAGRAAAIA
jgi:homocysteine S-methyltransferase